VVPFDKLRSLKKHSRFVPVTGDLMTSRWAFEAIAVNQFKRNRFEKHFFDADMRMSRNLYKSSFLIPRVVGYLDESLRSLESGKDSIKVESRLNIVKNVLTELQEETGSQSGLVRYLTPFLFNETIYGRVRSFIDSIKLISQNNYDLASREKDEIYFALEKQLGGKDALLSLQDNYVNRSITDLVLNRNQLKKIIEYDGHLIQRMDPVFEVPHSKFGRAHMYAPVKLLGNFNIDTYWFNLLVLWFTIAISYLILYYDLLKKMMTQLESALIRYRDKKRLRIQFSRK
jgi:hypothetical protein